MMNLTHPTCTELESWTPGKADGPVARHLRACSRCRDLAALLRQERIELARKASLRGILVRLEEAEAAAAVGTQGTAGTGASARSRVGSVPGESPRVREALRDGLAALTSDPERGVLWLELEQGKLCLGDIEDLRGYLEGLWFEAAAAPELAAEVERCMQRDVEWALAAARPTLSALGWFEETGSAERSAAGARGWARRTAGGLTRALDGKRRLRYVLALAPLALAALLLQSAESPLRYDQEPELIAKGAPRPALTLIVQRGEHQLEYERAAIIMPHDRLRLRFRLERPASVVAGISLRDGQWVPFFADEFAAGEHAPEATLSADEEPSRGRILLGTPRQVQAGIAGGSPDGLLSIELDWAAAVPVPTPDGE